MQPQALGLPAPLQVLGATHVLGQLTAFPQLSVPAPQAPQLLVVTVQPQALTPPAPPPQVVLPGHAGLMSVQFTGWPQLLVAGPQSLFMQVVVAGSGTQVQTFGVPRQALDAPQALQLAASQPLFTSVGTHFWLQFLVPAGHAPTSQVVPLQTSVAPGPGIGQLAFVHAVGEHP